MADEPQNGGSNSKEKQYIDIAKDLTEHFKHRHQFYWSSYWKLLIYHLTVLTIPIFAYHYIPERANNRVVGWVLVGISLLFTLVNVFFLSRRTKDYLDDEDHRLKIAIDRGRENYLKLEINLYPGDGQGKLLQEIAKENVKKKVMKRVKYKLKRSRMEGESQSLKMVTFIDEAKKELTEQEKELFDIEKERKKLQDEIELDIKKKNKFVAGLGGNYMSRNFCYITWGYSFIVTSVLALEVFFDSSSHFDEKKDDLKNCTELICKEAQSKLDFCQERKTSKGID